MKKIFITGMALSLTSLAFGQGAGYAPNDGSAKPGNPGTFTSPNSGAEKAQIMGPGTMGDTTGVDEATTTEAKENLERSNTSPNPIPTDTTLQEGKIQTGPYKTNANKQSQEATEEEFDYRSSPDASENQ